MKISIITPSYGQLDWLKLCVASVADQNQQLKLGSWKLEAGSLGGDAPAAQGVRVAESKVGKIANSSLEIVDLEGGSAGNPQQSVIRNQESPIASPLRVEHIIQDGGTPGIEEYAREVGAEFYRDGLLVFGARPSTFDARLYRLAIYSESDAGMYDAINKGIAKMSGDLWAWINSDEQYLPGTLAYVARWFEGHRDADILCGDALLTDDSGKALSYRRIVTPWWHHTRLIHLSSLSCASFYRRSIVERGGVFDTGWRSIGDAEWMARMMEAGVRIEACGKLFSTFAFTGQNTSESPLARKESAEWKKAADAPSAWMMLPVIGVHRCRKFLAGAYLRRDVSYAIHRQGEGRKEFRAKGIGWDWPSALSSRQSAASKSVPNAHVPYVDSTRVLGASLMETTYEDLSTVLMEAGSSGGGVLAVDFANTHVVTMRRHDPKFMNLTACIDLIAPDGMPLVWAMNAKGANLEDRVYGPTFTRRFLASCPAGKTHYLVGGSEECGRKFREQMLALNPSLNFVGGYHGLCSGDGELDDQKKVTAEILEKRPDFIWVGLGTPKQYAWIHRIKPQLDHGVLLAVGFAFDVNAGMKPDAPAWMQRLGLTWIHRMASEPGRLAGRYLKWNTLFIRYWIAEFVGGGVRSVKLHLRNAFLALVDLLSREIFDLEDGRSLGRALMFGQGGGVRVIGHEGLPPLIPRFIPQERLTYWKQSIGFTTPPRPDFPRLEGVSAAPVPSSPRVLNVVLTHLDGERLLRTKERWRDVCREEDLWIAYGGKQRNFRNLGMERSVFIGDAGLRREDNQREKQSYTGIFHAMAPVVEKERPDYIFLCEYDHVPLRPDLNALQVAEITAEGADVMGHWLYRVDGTSHYHMLYHQSDPGFLRYWQSVSRREEKGVVLSMFGSGSLWSREAFLAIASRTQQIPCYLELYLPTLAHHLGYRVRCWDESRHMISNLPSRKWTIDEAMNRDCLTIHPVK
jgi:N-acetylglucosaminyldiphosphoundecaprenol N-acetyl-beta-D-mannosaminyltransferase